MKNLKNYLDIGLGSLESMSSLPIFYSLGNGDINGDISDYLIIGTALGIIAYDGIQRINSNLNGLDYKKFKESLEKKHYDTKEQGNNYNSTNEKD